MTTRLYQYFEALQQALNDGDISLRYDGGAIEQSPANRNVILRYIKSQFGIDSVFSGHERNLVLRWIDRDTYNKYEDPEFGESAPDHIADATRFFNSSNPTKEVTMSAIKFETKHYVNGRDVTAMSVDDVFDVIQKSEARIKMLDSLENKPTVVTAEIQKLRDGISALVDHLNKMAAKDAPAPAAA